MKAGKIYLDLRQAYSTILPSEPNGYSEEVDKRITLLCEGAFSAVYERSRYDNKHAGFPDTINLIIQCMINVLGEIAEKTLDTWKDKHVSGFSKRLTTRSVDEQLLHAAENGALVLVQGILNDKANVESHDPYLRTPLILASISGHTAVVQILIQNHAHLTSQDHWGQTSLHYASAKGLIQVIKASLLHHAHGSIDIPNNKGETALDLAVRNNVEETVNLLLFYGAIDIDGNARRLSREGSMKGSEARPELASPDRLEEEALY